MSQEEVNIPGGHRIGQSKQTECICACVVFRTVSELQLFHCAVVCMYVEMHSDEQHAMSSHELQCAVMLTVEFSKMYCTCTVPTLSLEQQIPVLETVRWVPCHHGMARPQVADREDALRLWREAANILNKQSRTADKEWSSSLGVGRGTNNSSP
jgi:hypothetical protein